MSTVKRQSQTYFGITVRGELERRRMSLRELARRMAALDSGNVELHRRNLNRWINEGTEPSDESRTEVARALNVPKATLEEPEDDEEADRELVAALKRWRDRGSVIA